MTGNLSFHSFWPVTSPTAGSMGANRLDGFVLNVALWDTDEGTIRGVAPDVIGECVGTKLELMSSLLE